MFIEGIVMKRVNYLVLIFSCILVCGCATVPVTGRSQFSFVPQHQLLALSRESYSKVLKDSKISEDFINTQRVKDVGLRISQAAEDFMRKNGKFDEIKDFKWEFNLLEDEEKVNAFCMPGGKIVIYTGILPVTVTQEGLATVIGHEVAHALANHSGERMSQLLIAQLGGLSLSVALKEKNNTTKQLAMVAYGVGSNLAILMPYSRVHEEEADRIGLILMAKAGYDPRKAVPFWERMNALGGARKVPEFLSTHPTSKSRIASIKSYLPEALDYYYNEYKER